MLTREEILRNTLELLLEYREDFDYAVEEITEETRFLQDLGFESLEVVVFGMATQQHFGQVFPFNDYFTALGEREGTDLTLGEWVDFLSHHLNQPVNEQP